MMEKRKLRIGVIGCGEWLTVALVVIAGREVIKWKGSRGIDEESLGSN